MTTQQKRAYYERRNEIGREQPQGKQRKRNKTRRRKRREKLIFFVEVIGIVSLCSFLLGQNVGARQAEKKCQYMFSDETDGAEATVIEKDYYQKDILLVNKENSLPSDYKPKLLTLPDGVNRAAEEAYEPLCRMLKAGQQEGLSFEICSSYRDVERQQELFEEDLDALMRAGYSYTEAYEEVAKETMPPGYSEHSTGLAFDIVALDYQMLDEGQEDTAENQWLQEHCAEYGFILRYPKGKEEITAINYESWHFRYVGEEAARYIMENNLTLEEYLEL